MPSGHFVGRRAERVSAEPLISRSEIVSPAGPTISFSLTTTINMHSRHVPIAKTAPNPRFGAFRPRRMHEIGGWATFLTPPGTTSLFAFRKMPGHGLAQNRGRGSVSEKCRASPDLVHLHGAKCTRSGVGRHFPPWGSGKTKAARICAGGFSKQSLCWLNAYSEMALKFVNAFTTSSSVEPATTISMK